MSRLTVTNSTRRALRFSKRRLTSTFPFFSADKTQLTICLRHSYLRCFNEPSLMVSFSSSLNSSSSTFVDAFRFPRPPSDHLIDGVVFSSLRDQMIVMRGEFPLVFCPPFSLSILTTFLLHSSDQFDLGSALHLLFTNYNIHGEDVLSPDAWEISEEWLRAFPYVVLLASVLLQTSQRTDFFPRVSSRMLAHEALISSTNKWRLQRGLAPLVLEEIRDGVGGSH